ncbi:Flagellar motor switch protein FliN [Dissulfuribacter thermophilus]|uniref:Flagellar motor switch protein FliN n=1 Tax=Dissulfuribacter thermophilus TaxID=1156395 RepID=A0A1B9F833_9BACT|nr:flagellar motor switch protein FliN [Dissulfuribacter thermophilus]OCC16097.1 Flagellar motor switch protein FliN [Dissulfuribacter thermophilus]
MLSQEELDKLLEEGIDEQEGEGSLDAKSGSEGQQDAQQKTEVGDSKDGQESSTEDVSWDDAFKEAAQGGDEAAKKALDQGQVGSEGPKETDSEKDVAPNFSDFGQETSKKGVEHPDLDFILDIPLDVSVELGRAKLRIKDLLQLGQGSVVELNKLAGEPAEIYVNHKLMAKGEIVVVNEKFGVRLTEIISPSDRVKSLG